VLNVTVIFLSSRDVDEIMTPELAVRSSRLAFSWFSKGQVSQPRRQVLTVNGNWWGIMPSYGSEVFSLKVVNVIEGNRQRGLPTINGLVLLMSAHDGSPLAIIDGPTLTAWRTAAASVLSTELVMGRKVGTMGIVGAGTQAKYHHRVATGYLNVDQVLITARKGHLSLAKELGASPVEGDTLFKRADVVFAATSSTVPVVRGALLKDQFHVCSVGAHTMDSRELDDDTIRRTSTFLVDSLEAVSHESGDLKRATELGIRVMEIGRALEGGKIERPTVFKTVGIAAQDLAAALLLYQEAQRKGAGKVLE
jgi:alanine dehydrogenase